MIRLQVRGWLRVAENPRSRFILFFWFLHNINNLSYIIIVFNSFDIQIQLWSPEIISRPSKFNIV